MTPLRTPKPPATRIGVVGTGMISRSLTRLLQRHHPDLVVSRILTRRDPASVAHHDGGDPLTRSLDDLIDHSDLVVECSGDAVYGTDVLERVFAAGRPVVTMNSELQVTTGSYFVGKGYLTEAEGDQPGSLAALREEALSMGFRPLVYGNMKGFLNLDPSRQDMEFWSRKQGTSVTQTTSFTDGTKVQIEQALIANGTGATILRRGLEGQPSEDLKHAAFELAAKADALGSPIADYVLAVKWQANGVFVVGRHDDDSGGLLEYFKLGTGPYYMLTRPYHLCSLEIPKTIRRAIAGNPPLLTNSAAPTIGVAAIAKRALEPGTTIDTPIGGFQLRGEAVKLRDDPNHVPIGLLRHAVIRRRVEPGQTLSFDDVEMQDSRAVQISRGILEAAIATSRDH